ncbi:hypothetical protein FJZ39_01370 [Candidatus Saccharibacteria bacterium]|nr:hypothetical protein [Candidatus Saccharibacteria bacterium]
MLSIAKPILDRSSRKESSRTLENAVAMSRRIFVIHADIEQAFEMAERQSCPTEAQIGILGLTARQLDTPVSIVISNLPQLKAQHNDVFQNLRAFISQGETVRLMAHMTYITKTTPYLSYKNNASKVLNSYATLSREVRFCK